MVKVEKATGRVGVYMKKVGGFASVAVLAATLLATPATAQATVPTAGVRTAAAATGVLRTFDTQMITLINQARAKAGVAALTEAKGLTQLSVWWSGRLDAGATSYNLAHNPNAWTMLTSYGAANRTTWGENVAWSSSTATSAADIFTAYMNSPGHKANILGAQYRYIGMGTVGGAHGLFNTTEFTDKVEAGQAVVVAPKPPANNDFIKDSSTGAVYRVVGGAPVYVSTWAAFGGAQPTKTVTHAQLAAMRQIPVDGTFVRTAGNNQTYKIVGGAPVYVSNWASVGGQQSVTIVDHFAVDRAGQAGYYSHLRAVPVDGTFIRTTSNGATYRMAGGAPLYVSSWTPFGGAKPVVTVDPLAVANGGKSGAWSHLHWYPASPTYIQGAGGAAVYRVISGTATHLSSWAAVGGVKPVVTVDPKVISAAGTGGFYNHLKKA